MAVRESFPERIALREVAVRPVRDAGERRRWDALVSEFHYLPFHGLFGQSLRHVAVHGSTWVALVGWTAGRVQGRGAGSVDRLAAGTAVPALGAGRQQQPASWC